MSGKTVLITGGNAGIGKQTALALAKLGARVIITSRNLRKGDLAQMEIREATNSKAIDSLQLDLSSFASIERCAAELLAKYARLDVLVLNAGLILDTRSQTEQGFETTFGVNHLGHFYLVSLLRERVIASAPARVVVVSSDAHKAVRALDFDDLMAERSYKPFQVYASSKLANILFARELARQLEGTGVDVNAVHPGAVRTRFGRDGDVSGLGRALLTLASPFMLSAESGAKTSVHVASAPELEGHSGGYYVRCREAKPNAAASDPANAARLWQLSEELVAQARAAARAS